ncbi:MAG: hypothetical protein LBJ12_01430 [Oscillospiraceae bacterium]|jgi:hypothetical protein|nr:hypothetical protein [Oscillospiraceae bacterium]
MIFPNLVFDRDTSDLSNNTSKAYHNASDLQRINEACIYLSDIFNQIGLTNTIITKDQWGDFDYTVQNVGQIVQNISTLQEILEVTEFTPEVPEDFNKPTLEKANDLELILDSIYRLGNFLLTSDMQIFMTSENEIFLYKYEEAQ